MRNFVMGRGQIGTAVIELLADAGREIKTYDPKTDSWQAPTTETDVLHICFPFMKNFVDKVKWYKEATGATHVIIWSTLPIGTTKQIDGAVHTPVEGRHPELAKSIKSMTRWLGSNDSKELVFFVDYFIELYLKVKPVGSSDYTEFLKLRSTAKFGINLVWTDYEADVAHAIGMDFKLLKDFDRDYNKLYHNIGMDWAQRYILDPPIGHIGGHCVVPNAELLDEQYPSKLLKMIKEYK